jgi:hypothetical protein
MKIAGQGLPLAEVWFSLAPPAPVILRQLMTLVPGPGSLSVTQTPYGIYYPWRRNLEPVSEFSMS